MSLAKARWPLKMSQGFSPKPRVAFYSPLPVGTAGQEEYFDAFLEDETDMEDLAKSLTKSLPQGFGLREVFPIPPGDDSLEGKIVASQYLLDFDSAHMQSLALAIQKFLREVTVPFEVLRPKGKRVFDLREYVSEFYLEPCPSHAALMTVKHAQGRTARPQWVISSLEKYGAFINPLEVIIDRRKILFD